MIGEEPQNGINWTLIIVAVIAAIPGCLAAYFAWKARNQGQANAANLNRLEISVDGKLSDLLAAREDAASAKGQLKERDAERAHISQITPIEPAGSASDEPLKVEVTNLESGK